MNMNYVVQKLLENVIKRSLFPRSEICVYVQVVCDDGSISLSSFQRLLNRTCSPRFSTPLLWPWTTAVSPSRRSSPPSA